MMMIMMMVLMMMKMKMLMVMLLLTLPHPPTSTLPTKHCLSPHPTQPLCHNPNALPTKHCLSPIQLSHYATTLMHYPVNIT